MRCSVIYSQKRGDVFECAATSLMRKLEVDPETSSHMEDVIKKTLGSIYGGESEGW